MAFETISTFLRKRFPLASTYEPVLSSVGGSRNRRLRRSITIHSYGEPPYATLRRGRFSLMERTSMPWYCWLISAVCWLAVDRLLRWNYHRVQVKRNVREQWKEHKRRMSALDEEEEEFMRSWRGQ